MNNPITVSATLLSQLKKFAEQGKEWEELETPIPGIFVVKPKPKKDEHPSLLLEIRPTNSEGIPTGRSKLFIKNVEVLQRLQNSIIHDKILELTSVIETLNNETASDDKEKVKITF